MQNIQNIFICLVLVCFSLLLSHKEYKKNNKIINVISIFSIGFLLPFAISFLKLSKLSSEYDTKTIILVVGSFLSFYYGVRFSDSKNRNDFIKKNNVVRFKDNSRSGNEKRKSKKVISINDHLINIYNIVLENFNAQNVLLGIFLVSFVSFLIEVMVLKFIPLFSFGTPHAYSSFHIFGIHYITTLYFMMPGLAILNLSDRAHTVRPKVILIISIVYAVVMSLMLVSRALLIMTVVMAGLTYVMRAHTVRPYGKGAHTVRPYDKRAHTVRPYDKRAHTVRPYSVGVSLRARSKNVWVKKNIIPVICIICFVGLYISITVLRSHSVSYLNDIFEMKDNTPIYITQPYMYLTQGFENLNYLVTHNERFTFGRRTLAPLFSLLRTKKYFPLVTEAPFYQIKLELTSKPIIYDLYYDFSMIGTFIIMFIIGYIVKKIEIKNYKENNIYYNLFFGLICYYLLFSFFQSYLSLLDTWFYLIFTYILYAISKLLKAKK